MAILRSRVLIPACAVAVASWFCGAIPALAQSAAPAAQPPAPRPPALIVEKNPEDQISKEGTAQTSPESELNDIYFTPKPTLDSGGLESPVEFLSRQSKSLFDATGLRLGFAYTMLFQQATLGRGTRDGTSGDIDFMSDWTLINRGGVDTGRFVLTAEYRFKVGTQPASRVGPEIGALTNTTGGFNDRGWAVRDAFWAQRLFDDHLRFQVGRFDISDNVGAYRLQSINNSFSNRAFSALATAAFPGHGPGALVTIRPTDEFYATAGATNATGSSTEITVSDLVDNWDLFYTAEAGYTPLINGLGRGRYAVMYWYVDGDADLGVTQDQGFALIAEQDLGERLYGFGRYQYANDATQNIDYSVQIGGGINGLLGSPDNLTALAFSYADCATSGSPDEKVAELFHRWQLTDFTQFSIGGQCIIDPSNAPEDNVLGVFTARFRIAF